MLWLNCPVRITDRLALQEGYRGEGMSEANTFPGETILVGRLNHRVPVASRP